MKKSRIQVILPDVIVESFDKEAKKQGRSKSNLARKYIIEGLAKSNQESK